MIARVCQGQTLDLEAMEFFVRSAVLGWGARVIEKALSDSGDGDRRRTIKCRCGHKMISHGRRVKTLRTILGHVKIRRAIYCCPHCRAKRIPLDEALGVCGTGFSPGARRLMARAGSRESFAEAVEDLKVYAQFEADAKDVERVAESVGRQVDEWAHKVATDALLRDAAGLPPLGVEGPIPVLYISFDGTGIPMRRAALAGRRGKQPDGTAKTREVKLGCVFTQTTTDDQGRPVRDPASTTYVAAIEDSQQFGYRIHGEAVRRGLRLAQRVIVLVDGAPYNKTIAKEHFPMALLIIDLYHARKHLQDFCKLLPVAQRDTAREEKWLALLDAGQIETLTHEMAAAAPDEPQTRDNARKEIHYFIENAEAMRYQAFREQGFFIGSGVIEAGCKTVVGKRLKQSGMFWAVPGANAILALCTCQYSKRFEQFWEDQAA